MVVQTHHYRRPVYVASAFVFVGLGVALLVLAHTQQHPGQLGLIAAAAASLHIGLFLVLRHRNECIYFAPDRLIYVDCLGRRRVEVPFEDLSAIRPVPGTLGLVQEIQSRRCRIRFDASITEGDALKGELDWQIMKRQPGSPTQGTTDSARVACPPQGA